MDNFVNQDQGQPLGSYDQRSIEIARRLALAKQLSEQGSQSIQTNQMVSGHVIPFNWAQGLAQGLQSYMGGRQQHQADQLSQQNAQGRQQALAQLLSDPSQTPEQIYSAGATNPNLGGDLNTQFLTQGFQQRSAAQSQAAAEQRAQAAADAAEKRAAASQAAAEARDAARAQAAQEAQGRQFAETERLAGIRASTQPPDRELVTVIGEDGQPVLIPRSQAAGKHPATTEKPITEFQGKQAQFASRAEQANKNYQTAGINPSLTSRTIGDSMVGNMALDDKTQQALQAEKEFVQTAVLRADSGAAISKSEYEQYGKVFFPRPGDSPAVIKQKAEARQSAIDGLKGSAGQAAMKAMVIPSAAPANDIGAAAAAELARRRAQK